MQNSLNAKLHFVSVTDRRSSQEKFQAPQQYAASKLITAPYVAAIRTQSTFMLVGEQSVEDLKRQQQSLKTMAANLRREAIDASLLPNLLRSTMLARDKGASS